MLVIFICTGFERYAAIAISTHMSPSLLELYLSLIVVFSIASLGGRYVIAGMIRNERVYIYPVIPFCTAHGSDDYGSPFIYLSLAYSASSSVAKLINSAARASLGLTVHSNGMG